MPRGLSREPPGAPQARRTMARRRRQPSRRHPRPLRRLGRGLVHAGHRQANAVGGAGLGQVRHDGGGLAGDGAPVARRSTDAGHRVLRRGRGRVPRLLPQRAGRRVRVLVRRRRDHDVLVQAAEAVALLRRVLRDVGASRARCAAATPDCAAVLRQRADQLNHSSGGHDGQRHEGARRVRPEQWCGVVRLRSAGAAACRLEWEVQIPDGAEGGGNR